MCILGSYLKQDHSREGHIVTFYGFSTSWRTTAHSVRTMYPNTSTCLSRTTNCFTNEITKPGRKTGNHYRNGTNLKDYPKEQVKRAHVKAKNVHIETFTGWSFVELLDSQVKIGSVVQAEFSLNTLLLRITLRTVEMTNSRSSSSTKMVTKKSVKNVGLCLFYIPSQ